MGQLRVALRSGTLVAILWHQGEAGAYNADRAANYAARWVAAMTQLRADACTPDVPTIAGELGEFLERPYATLINEQIGSLPGLLDHVAAVSAKGLRDLCDELHFDAAAFLVMVPAR